MSDEAAPPADAERVRYRLDNRVAHIVLNRPEVLNAVDDAMRAALTGAFATFDLDDGADVALLYGEGRAFCAGADIKRRFHEGTDTDRNRRFLQSTPLGYLGQTQNWKPVIAAVHGHCVGAGFNLALECDLVVATEDARFSLPEVKHGLAAGHLWAKLQTFMPSKIASEILLLGDSVEARQLHAMGLVNRVVAPETHLAEAEALARRLVAIPAAAVRANCRLARWHWSRLSVDADAYTTALRLHQSPDFKAAARAFTEQGETRPDA